MKISIPYSKDKIEIDIPDGNIGDIVSGDSKVLKRDEKGIIEKALKDPIGSPPLSEVARGKTSVAILASDITRPCPSYKFLPQLIEELVSGGIEPEDIQVVLGLGIHRPHTEDERKKLVGDYVFKNAKVMDSDPSKTKLIGYTSAGTPVEVFEEALNSDLLIATGNIEYHYFAGYSGGAKALMPGICSRTSIQANHCLMLDDKAKASRVNDNPVRIDIEEAGKLAGIDFIFNVILDDDKNIIGAVAGKNNEAFLEGVKRYDSIYKIEVNSPADIVIASPGGHPKDINLYQSQKALENIKGIAKPAGTIILIAACPEGFGEDTFKEWMARAKDYDAISRRLKDKFVLGGHKAVAVSKVIKDIKVYLYSEFDRAVTEDMGFLKLEDIQSYLEKEIKENSNIKITLVPNGRFVRLKS